MSRRKRPSFNSFVRDANLDHFFVDSMAISFFFFLLYVYRSHFNHGIYILVSLNLPNKDFIREITSRVIITFLICIL